MVQAYNKIDQFSLTNMYKNIQNMPITDTNTIEREKHQKIGFQTLFFAQPGLHLDHTWTVPRFPGSPGTDLDFT